MLLGLKQAGGRAGSSCGSMQEREKGLDQTVSVLVEKFLRQKEHLEGLRWGEGGNN